MEEDTALLAEYFGPPEQYEEQITPEIMKAMEQQRAKEPGFLFDITDFSKIVQFGCSAGGAPFCFDFGEDLQEPSVILHDDSYARWRRIAPSFDRLISLFKPYGTEE
jgi:hypothetical protein